MIAIETIGSVTNERVLSLQLPTSVVPGRHKIILVIEEYPEQKTKRSPLEFRPYPIGLTSNNITFRREDEYGDDGR